MKREIGLTLLELIVSLAIIGIVLVVTVPGFSPWKSEKTFNNTYTMLQDELNNLRSTAISMTTTTVMVVTQTGTTYSLSGYNYSLVPPATTCPSATPGVGWTLLYTKTIPIATNYQITGNIFPTNTCFFHDGSSSGSNFVVSQVPDTSCAAVTIPNSCATISVTTASGYVDVEVN